MTILFTSKQTAIIFGFDAQASIDMDTSTLIQHAHYSYTVAIKESQRYSSWMIAAAVSIIAYATGTFHGTADGTCTISTDSAYVEVDSGNDVWLNIIIPAIKGTPPVTAVAIINYAYILGSEPLLIQNFTNQKPHNFNE